jgi:hypothetical protein
MSQQGKQLRQEPVGQAPDHALIFLANKYTGETLATSLFVPDPGL